MSSQSDDENEKRWTVIFLRGVGKRLAHASLGANIAFEDLVEDLRSKGPKQEDYSDYQAVTSEPVDAPSQTIYSCRLDLGADGKTARWRVVDDAIEINVWATRWHDSTHERLPIFDP